MVTLNKYRWLSPKVIHTLTFMRFLKALLVVLKMFWTPVLFKACVRYFLTNFYFSPNVSRSKTVKDVFHLI